MFGSVSKRGFSAGALLVLFAGGLIAFCIPVALAQTGNRFDVASVRPTPATEQGMRVMYDPNHFVMTNTTVLSLIELAYNMNDYQIADAPEWVRSLHVDVDAKVDPENLRTNATTNSAPSQPPDLDQKRLREEVRNLLADRFALRITQTTENKPAYFLMPDHDQHRKLIVASNAAPMVQTGAGHLRCTHASMQDLADWLSQTVQRQVVDKTGLSGFYAFTLGWDPAGGMEMSEDKDRPPDVFTALKQQLGLKLKAGRAPTPVLHIVSVSRSSPN